MKTLKKLTQRQAIFYQLYNNRKSGAHAYIPVFEFMGEVHCTELDLWGFVSHECSARMSELYNDNPNLVEYIEKKARAGGIYRCWRIKTDAISSAITGDPELAVYNRIKIRERNSKPIERCAHGIPTQALCPTCAQ